MDIIDGSGLWSISSAGAVPPIPPAPVLPVSVSGGQIRQLWPPEVVDNAEEMLVIMALVDQWL